MNSSTPSYADWKASREYDRSYDVYRREFPEVREYYIYRLDPNTKMSHIEEFPFWATDDLAAAHGYIYDMFTQHSLQLCIYQPRSDGYAGYYRISTKHSKRDTTGRFAKV